MAFSISFYIALGVFGLGLIYRVSTWFRYGLRVEARKTPAGVRAARAIRGIALTLLSGKIFTLLKVFLLEVLLQRKVFRQDLLRWAMHMCIYGGFMLLLLMHALERTLTSRLFKDYSSTLNPFMFLRDLFLLLVLAGIAIAVYRRFVLKIPRLSTNGRDSYALVILAVIMLSGLFLESSKIVSHTRYREMVEDYLVGGEEKELKALEAYWVKEFAVVSPEVNGPFDPETLRLGAEVHENSCKGCHSRPQWAFLGYAGAKIVGPAALGMDRAGIPKLLWYIHFLACWVGLAYLPFSKMQHILLTPLSLLAGAVMEKGRSDPANLATRQVMELDACMHCCTCTMSCSAGSFFEYVPNRNIFPSEKLIPLKTLAAGKALSEQDVRSLQEGVYLCTNCKRCTVLCPAGINLQDLWFDVRELLLRQGYPEPSVLSPFSYYRGLMRGDVDPQSYGLPLDRARRAIEDRCEGLTQKDQVLNLSGGGNGFKAGLMGSLQGGTFAGCFGCETCTTVCPVVAAYENPQEALGLLPHQIMHSCGLGLKDLALGSNMLWYCLTCYRCQEMCPQKVCVTDVFYELKNRAVKQGKDKPWQRTASA